MASIAIRAAVSAADAFQADDLPLSVQTRQQLVAAALAGPAVSSFEEMTKLGIPIVIDRAQADAPHTALSTWAFHVRDDAVAARADTALRRAYQRAGRPVPDAVTFQFQKLKVATTITQHIRRHGLFVYTQKLLFAPEFEAVGMAVLKEMRLPELPPVSASAAVAVGRLPALPSAKLKQHLDFLAGQRMRAGGVSFAQWVAEYAPILVEFPAPDLEPGRVARTDRYTEHPKYPGAELGLGFFLATTHDQIGERIQIVTPLLSHKPRGGPAAQPWTAFFVSQQVHRGIMEASARKRLRAVLADIGGQSARLKVCPRCAEIHSDDRADLKRRCACKGD